MPNRRGGAWALCALLCALTGAAAQDEDWPRVEERPATDAGPRRAEESSVPEPAPERERLRAPWAWDDEPSFDSHVRLSAFWLPAVKLVADRDYLEPEDGLLFHAQLRTGGGWGGAFAIGGEHIGVGGLYMFSEHRDRRTGDVCQAHAGYLELTLEGALPQGGPLLISGGVGIGLGGAVLDFRENTYDDAGGISFELRAWAGLRLLERVELTVGGGGFEWGVPGETIGYGGFATVGLTLRF